MKNNTKPSKDNRNFQDEAETNDFKKSKMNDNSDCQGDNKKFRGKPTPYQNGLYPKDNRRGYNSIFDL